MEIIAAWSREPRILDLNPEQYAFIDTETTGLAGGTGTYAFLIGVGRFEGDEFRLVQFFLQDPGVEIAQLAALSEFLAPCEVIVSFNGKSFDIPLINTRYIMNGWPPPLSNVAHLDLLHLGRRLWKARLSSCTLGNLESRILGTKRSEQDVPGWMIPDLYFDYLNTGDARPLRGVFYHNEIDVVSLAALLNYMARITCNPEPDLVEHSSDMLSIGKLYADLGFLEKAASIYQSGLEMSDHEDEAYWSGLRQLSYVHKKLGDYESAIPLWTKAARNMFLYAHEELAKYYEHREHDYKLAMKWTDNALEIVTGDDFPEYERLDWVDSLEHRKNRLVRRNTQ